MPLHVEVVAAERSVLSAVPNHAPLLTLLEPGELRLKRGEQEQVLAVSGGFLEVADNQVVVLADSAERAEEIDIARAEEARRRAQERLSSHAPDLDFERARAALLRALARLHAVERTRRRVIRQ
jgi:F-type H+-transporting ATPase subunit epsilon